EEAGRGGDHRDAGIPSGRARHRPGGCARPPEHGAAPPGGGVRGERLPGRRIRAGAGSSLPPPRRGAGGGERSGGGGPARGQRSLAAAGRRDRRGSAGGPLRSAHPPRVRAPRAGADRAAGEDVPPPLHRGGAGPPRGRLRRAAGGPVPGAGAEAIRMIALVALLLAAGALPEASPISVSLEATPEEISLGDHVQVRLSVEHDARDVYSLPAFDPAPLAAPPGAAVPRSRRGGPGPGERGTPPRAAPPRSRAPGPKNPRVTPAGGGPRGAGQ